MKPTPPSVVTRRLDLVFEKPLRWLWKDRIPAGAFTLLAGDPGTSKSTLALDIAARVSTGAAWPDGAGNARAGDVIIVQCEDSIEHTVIGRLRVAGADLSRIHTVEGIAALGGGGISGFSLSYVDSLRRLVDSVRPELVIIDPIGAFMGRIDGNDASAVRGALLPLQMLAGETGVAVLAVAHPNKGAPGQRAMHRIAGSQALVAASRAAWYVFEDKEDPDRRLFLKAKMNLAPDVGGLAYRIENVRAEQDTRRAEMEATFAEVPEWAREEHILAALKGPFGDHPRVRWEVGRIDVSADDVMGDAEAQGKLEAAEDWLRGELRNGSRSANDLKGAARDARIAWRTVERAKASLKVASTQTPQGWIWTLVDIDGAFPPPKA